MVKIEGDLEELVALLAGAMNKPAKKKRSTSKKPATATKPAAKKKRKPTAYQIHMKKELARLKKKHPKTAHNVLFTRAAKSWRGGKKK